MKQILFTLILSSISLLSFTQNQYISGTIVDSGTQEAMPFCKLTLKQDTVVSAFAVSDMNGYFELPATYGNYDLSIKFIGYTTDSMTIEIRNKNIFLGTIRLKQNNSTLNVVEVKGSIRDVNIDKNEYIITDKMRVGTSKAIDLLDKVEDALSLLPRAAQIAWEYSIVIKEDSLLVQELVKKLKLDIDLIFKTASEL